jgi:glucose-6-phosphate isomerase
MCGLRILDIPGTRFIAISNLSTADETLSQILTAFKFIEDAGHGSLIPKLFLGVTAPAKPGAVDGLRALFSARGIPLLPHSTEIGGPFSAFTAAGLLPALARGLDPAAIREGGLEVVRQLMQANMPEEHPAAVGAALAIGLAKDLGVINFVLMPYSDRLERFTAWYVQLCAESLGKGGEGPTPIAALGPSQLQVFMDGPHVRFLTVLRVAGAQDEDSSIPPQLAAEADAPYLAGRSIGALVQAQQKAIVDALIEAKRPVRTIDVDKLDERTLGALMMHFMIETILAADLLDVDPFNRPAVDPVGRLTLQYLAG